MEVFIDLPFLDLLDLHSPSNFKHVTTDRFEEEAALLQRGQHRSNMQLS